MKNATIIRKTIRYGQKNGWRPAFYTAIERLKQKKDMSYTFVPESEQELKREREHVFKTPYKISLLVPAYETKPVFLKALIESVRQQTYPFWELIIADASAGQVVKNTVDGYDDARIIYHKLAENGGISENTNQAMTYASGEYCALLDHDDLLTENALYEMAAVIENAKEQGMEPAFLYSDEDKCDTEGRTFFDLHAKTDFNYELLLTNNYICHFLVVRTDLLKQTGFRKEYDGAQDFDLVLRLVSRVKEQCFTASDWKTHIFHIPKVLYHWRCHMDSTSENPESKMYAYESGKKALMDYYEKNNIDCTVTHGMHLGFYRTVYLSTQMLFSQRREVGVVGGLLTHKGKIYSGAYTADGSLLYEGICKNFAGYMNRLHLTQNVDAVDIRCMSIPKRWEKCYEEIVGCSYHSTFPEEKAQNVYGIRVERLTAVDGFSQMSEEEIRKKSIAFCKAVREAGEEVILDPLYRRSI